MVLSFPFVVIWTFFKCHLAKMKTTISAFSWSTESHGIIQQGSEIIFAWVFSVYFWLLVITASFPQLAISTLKNSFWNMAGNLQSVVFKFPLPTFWELSLLYFSGISTIFHDNAQGFHNQIGNVFHLAIIIAEQNNYCSTSVFNSKVLVGISVFSLSRWYI